MSVRGSFFKYAQTRECCGMEKTVLASWPLFVNGDLPGAVTLDANSCAVILVTLAAARRAAGVSYDLSFTNNVVAEEVFAEIVSLSFITDEVSIECFRHMSEFDDHGARRILAPNLITIPPEA